MRNRRTFLKEVGAGSIIPFSGIVSGKQPNDTEKLRKELKENGWTK